MPVRIVRLGDRDDSVFIRHLMPVADTIVCDYGNQLRVVKLPVAEKLEWFNWFCMRILTYVFSGQQVHCYGNWNTTWETLYLNEYFLHVRFGCPWLSLSLTSVHCCTSVVLPVMSYEELSSKDIQSPWSLESSWWQKIMTISSILLPITLVHVYHLQNATGRVVMKIDHIYLLIYWRMYWFCNKGFYNW